MGDALPPVVNGSEFQLTQFTGMDAGKAAALVKKQVG